MPVFVSAETSEIIRYAPADEQSGGDGQPAPLTPQLLHVFLAGLLAEPEADLDHQRCWSANQSQHLEEGVAKQRCHLPQHQDNRGGGGEK